MGKGVGVNWESASPEPWRVGTKEPLMDVIHNAHGY